MVPLPNCNTNTTWTEKIDNNLTILNNQHTAHDNALWENQRAQLKWCRPIATHHLQQKNKMLTDSFRHIPNSCPYVFQHILVFDHLSWAGCFWEPFSLTCWGFDEEGNHSWRNANRLPGAFCTRSILVMLRCFYFPHYRRRHRLITLPYYLAHGYDIEMYTCMCVWAACWLWSAL